MYDAGLRLRLPMSGLVGISPFVQALYYGMTDWSGFTPGQKTIASLEMIPPIAVYLAAFLAKLSCLTFPSGLYEHTPYSP